MQAMNERDKDFPRFGAGKLRLGLNLRQSLTLLLRLA